MGQLQARTLEDLEGELQERAFARNAELLTGRGRDGRVRAAFVQFGDRISRRGVVVLEAVAGDTHVALECLLAADAERASARRWYRSTAP
ncbi:MAG: hypothetical protein QOI89_1800 [Solirubrobacteraceae bacterium]|jgi:hypothetical protein|nr:hypothetical protein [Solirubrobacteraceae bacterium]